MNEKDESSARTVCRIDHFVENGQEIVTINEVTYVVDRDRKELRRATSPTKVLSLEQRQYGRTPTGDLEILDWYQSDDGSVWVIIDSSPSWLWEIGVK